MAATKDKEREALKKIRAIVDELGEDSYISYAFKGCFEDAEENIENDFALSMSDRYEKANKLAEEFKKKYHKVVNDMSEVISAKDAAMKTLKTRAEVAESKVCQMEDTLSAADAILKRADAVEFENMKLKAKLYDLMMERGA